MADQIASCATLNESQASRLGLRDRREVQATVDGKPTRGCAWIGQDIGYNIQFIPIPTEAAIGLPGAEITQVNGFGAVRNIPDTGGGPPICQIAVDIASEQSIRVQANSVPDASYNTEELCRRATEAASLVMTTVVATASR